MKTTGYALRDALKQHELLRETAASGFLGSFKKFPNETKISPVEIAKQVQIEEEKIALLQAAQALYNTRVRLTVEGKDLLLTEAIKSEETVEHAAEDLLGMEGMDGPTARMLAAKGITTMSALADLATDELSEITGMDADRASKLIMTARAPLFEQPA